MIANEIIATDRMRRVAGGGGEHFKTVNDITLVNHADRYTGKKEREREKEEKEGGKRSCTGAMPENAIKSAFNQAHRARLAGNRMNDRESNRRLLLPRR